MRRSLWNRTFKKRSKIYSKNKRFLLPNTQPFWACSLLPPPGILFTKIPSSPTFNLCDLHSRTFQWWCMLTRRFPSKAWETSRKSQRTLHSENKSVFKHTPSENACNHLCFSFKTKQSKSVCLVYSVFKYVFLYRGSYGGSTTFDCGSFARTTGKIQETLLKYFAAFPYQAYQASLSMFLIPSGKLTSMKEEAILTFVQWSESVLGNERHCYFFVKSLPASVSKNY